VPQRVDTVSSAIISEGIVAWSNHWQSNARGVGMTCSFGSGAIIGVVNVKTGRVGHFQIDAVTKIDVDDVCPRSWAEACGQPPTVTLEAVPD
jgi:hypothetical protein